MAKYKGNDGNLLQHWVLCELLQALAKTPHELAFVDAYSMSPCATEMHERGDLARFNSVRRRLPGQRSVYELTWNRLASDCEGYPNSAAFVRALWPHRFSLLLCEKDPSTFQDLEHWKPETADLPNCTGIDLHPGDWRKRFTGGLRPEGDIVFFSFDPNMFDQNPNVNDRKPENMYPCDLEALASTLQGVSQPALMQLSTYSANNGNSQELVVKSVRSLLQPSGLKILAIVRVNKQMMSIVLGRNIEWPDSLRSLDRRFDAWFEGSREPRL